jgi:serine/threonine protein kinase
MSTTPFRPDEAQLADELCDRFEDALKRGERPRIEDWLPDSGAARAEALPELVALKLDYRVRAGDDSSAADYFARFPELRSDPTVALRLVQVELRAAQLRNPSVTEASFRERYPDLASLPEWSGNQLLTTPQLGTTPFRPSGETKTDGPPTAPSDPMVFLKSILKPPAQSGELGRFGEFRVLRVLGAGGMGVVLEALDEALNRKVAIKLMRPEVAVRTTAKERFLREARAMAAVEHPRIVIVHSVGEREGVPYLVMPLMAGGSLAKRLKAGSPLPVEEAVRFAREAADGLAAAHAKGVIHRDVKPDNIWLEETAEGMHVRLLDFGLARDDGAEPLTQSGAIFGTPAYMAPEQAAGEKVDGRADLFSLGCVLYEMATGTRAFAGPSITAILFALANRVPPAARTLNPAIPAALSDLIDRLLGKNREERPATAGEVATALRAIEAGDPTTTVEWKPQRRVGRRSFTVGCTVTLSLCLVVVFAMPDLFRQDRTGTNSVPSPDAAGPSFENIKPRVAAPPLVVKSIVVKHFAPGPNGDVAKGVLGESSEPPRLGDKVQVVATLSKPAYAYLLAFRPDGEIEVCDPEDESTVPKLTSSPRYPANDATKAYGLTDGTGLWLFAVVASEKPLPPFKEWIAKLKPEWSREPATGTALWWYDGLNLETAQLGRVTTRGKGDDLTGPAATVVAMGRKLKADEAVVGVVGFGVAPKP